MSYIPENIQKWLAREILSADDPCLFWWTMKQVLDELAEEINSEGIETLERYLHPYVIINKDGIP